MGLGANDGYLFVLGLIAALAPLFQPFISDFLRRRRPRFVKCDEIERASLPRWREEERQTSLKVQIGDRPIRSPSFSRVRARNMGDEPLKEIRLFFEVEGAEIVEILASPGASADQLKQIQKPSEDDRGRWLVLSVLNSYREFGTSAELKFDVICNGTIERLAVSGSGEGWIADFDDLPIRGRNEALASLATYGGIFGWLIIVPLMISYRDPKIQALLSSLLTTEFALAWLIPPLIAPFSIGWWANRKDIRIPGPSEAVRRLAAYY